MGNERIDLTYITIYKRPREEKKLTDTYHVVSQDNDIIGIIKWYGAWRKYCFFPEQNTVFEEKCLNEISEFIVKTTKEQKNNKNIGGK